MREGGICTPEAGARSSCGEKYERVKTGQEEERTKGDGPILSAIIRRLLNIICPIRNKDMIIPKFRSLIK